MPQYITNIRPEIFEWQVFASQIATDISIGVNGALWIVGMQERRGGGQLLQRRGRGWQMHDVGAVAVEVGPHGQPWLIDDEGQVRYLHDGRWTDAPGLPGPAVDLGIGADGSVWGIAENGNSFRVLRRWDGTEWADAKPSPSPYRYPHFLPWTVGGDRPGPSAPVNPRRVAVAADGQPWVADHDGMIYRAVPGGWRVEPEESAKEIAVGSDGNVWILSGADTRPGGFGPYRYYHGTDWDCYEGAGVRLAVAPDGLPWLVDNQGNVHCQHVRI